MYIYLYIYACVLLYACAAVSIWRLPMLEQSVEDLARGVSFSSIHRSAVAAVEEAGSSEKFSSQTKWLVSREHVKNLERDFTKIMENAYDIDLTPYHVDFSLIGCDETVPIRICGLYMHTCA